MRRLIFVLTWVLLAFQGIGHAYDGHFTQAAENSVAGAGTSAAEGGTLDIGASETWGNASTLERHFADHGADFEATSAEDYANQASEFPQNSQAQGLPTKIDANGDGYQQSGRSSCVPASRMKRGWQAHAQPLVQGGCDQALIVLEAQPLG